MGGALIFFGVFIFFFFASASASTARFFISFSLAMRSRITCLDRQRLHDLARRRGAEAREQRAAAEGHVSGLEPRSAAGPRPPPRCSAGQAREGRNDLLVRHPLRAHLGLGAELASASTAATAAAHARDVVVLVLSARRRRRAGFGVGGVGDDARLGVVRARAAPCLVGGLRVGEGVQGEGRRDAHHEASASRCRAARALHVLARISRRGHSLPPAAVFFAWKGRKGSIFAAGAAREVRLVARRCRRRRRRFLLLSARVVVVVVVVVVVRARSVCRRGRAGGR